MKWNRSLKIQLRNNEVGIISLVVAILALFLNTWLYTRSETNRNIRVASFEVLIHLGELQQVVNNVHFKKNDSFDVISRGWGHLALIGDLSHLIPQPIPEEAQALINSWKENLDNLKESDESTAQVSNKIDALRHAIIEIITNLS